MSYEQLKDMKGIVKKILCSLKLGFRDGLT